jgi:hypothetical protein
VLVLLCSRDGSMPRHRLPNQSREQTTRHTQQMRTKDAADAQLHQGPFGTRAPAVGCLLSGLAVDIGVEFLGLRRHAAATSVAPSESSTVGASIAWCRSRAEGVPSGQIGVRCVHDRCPAGIRNL